jgi:hypothetical protein
MTKKRILWHADDDEDIIIEARSAVEISKSLPTRRNFYYTRSWYLFEGAELARHPKEPQMFMHYTISQDRSGDNNEVMASILSVLGEKEDRAKGKGKADLTLLADRGHRNAEKEKSPLAWLGEREERRGEFMKADLSLLGKRF